MPLPAQLDIYKASAGSGKTFLLTLKYLQLVFEQPSNYRHVLAVTFTNKATAEMKERILGELKNMAQGKETIYAHKLLEVFAGKTFAILQEDARKVYSSILHDYSRFAVTTIDSFVQKIIRSFAFEIGLDAGFRLQLNVDPVKEDLADRLFRLLDTDDNLRNWIKDLVIKRMSEGKSWNFRDDMLQLANELFKEPFQEFDGSIKSLPDVDGSFKAFRENVFSSVKAFEEKWMNTGKKAVALLAERDLVKDDFYYGKSGFINYIFKAVEREIEAPGKRVTAFCENPDQIMGKTKNRAVYAIQNDLCTLLEQLIDQWETGHELYHTALVLSKNIGNLRLMQVFSEQLSHYRSENNALLISDTHLLLRQLTRDAEASFIYEKTGSRFRHFLIDEFQDTSGFQWDNFKPLLENALGEGNYNLLVGDVKQAIYRWRSGDWQLLQKKVRAQLSHTRVALHSLQDNRRSARPVISFNNFLYKAAPGLLQSELNGAMAEAPPAIHDQLVRDGFNGILEEAYAESFQHVPENASSNGQVEIRFYEIPEPDNVGNDNQEVSLANEDDAENYLHRQLYNKICGLLDEGFMAKDIAILTRKNKEATEIITSLMNFQRDGGQQFELLSAEALLLANNNAVSIIIQAMEVLAGDGGKLALAHLRQLVALQKGEDRFSDYDLYISKADQERVLPPSFLQRKAELHRLPLMELINSLIQIFDLNKDNSNAAYLLAFQDVAGSWSRYGSEGLRSFLQYWEDEGRTISLPGGANTNAVEVLSIHQSKGLAFTVLLLPHLDWELKPNTFLANQLWVETEQTQFNEIPLVPVRYGSDLQKTSFAYSYFEELLLSMMDNLNLLYVATTRARRRIVGWAPKPSKIDKLNTINQMLYAVATTVSHESVGLEKDGVPFSFDADTDTWVFGTDEVTPVITATSQPELMAPLVQSSWKDRLTVRYNPLMTEDETSIQLPRAQGVLLHEAISLLKDPDGVEMVLLRMRQRGLMTPSQQQQVRETFLEILRMPVFEGWKNGSMQRLSEREIVTPAKELRRPDLVLYNGESTIVIDFKFTSDRKADERYRQQVSEYILLLQQTGFSNVSGFLLYAGDIIELVPVTTQPKQL